MAIGGNSKLTGFGEAAGGFPSASFLDASPLEAGSDFSPSDLSSVEGSIFASAFPFAGS